MESQTPSSVVVGLSSGVDSCVAAWLLKRQGHEVIGVTLALAEPYDVGQVSLDSSPASLAKASAIAKHLGIPHHVVDETETFRSEVVEYFISEYEEGRTPNPCAKCNSRVRFPALLAQAERLGASMIATGHYARSTGQERRLARGVDRKKDQSYVLAEVAPSLLERCAFPLGDLTKEEVRSLASQMGAAGLVSQESQDICFVPAGGYREFLRSRLGERPGPVVDEAGKAIGTHTGTYNYTVGQRRGLGPGGGPTQYVTRVDAARNRVVAGEEAATAVREIGFSLSARHRATPSGSVDVQFRSMGSPVKGRLGGPGSILLERPAYGVAPGQTIVAYDKDDVVLGGTISSTSRDVT